MGRNEPPEPWTARKPAGGCGRRGWGRAGVGEGGSREELVMKADEETTSGISHKREWEGGKGGRGGGFSSKGWGRHFTRRKGI